MKILITGGLGFIGKNLVSILCRYKKITKIIVIDKNIPDRKYLRIFMIIVILVTKININLIQKELIL